MKIPFNQRGDKIFSVPASVFAGQPSPAGGLLYNSGNEAVFIIRGHIWRECLHTELEELQKPRDEEYFLKKNGWSAAIVTLSDKGFLGLRKDESGPLIQNILQLSLKPIWISSFLLPDEKSQLKALLCHLAMLDRYDLIITTGGTGLAERDITPQVTSSLLDLPLPGFVNAMLLASLAKTPNAVISRAEAGVIDKTLVINLPGSKKAVKENLEAVLPALDHALAKINGDTSDCGAKS